MALPPRLLRSRHLSWFAHMGAVYLFHDLFGYLMEMSPDIADLVEAFAEEADTAAVLERFANRFEGADPAQFIDVLVRSRRVARARRGRARRRVAVRADQRQVEHLAPSRRSPHALHRVGRAPGHRGHARSAKRPRCGTRSTARSGSASCAEARREEARRRSCAGSRTPTSKR